MFKKILIANRGEIACRVMRTAKRMKIKTVAVYSDADRHGRHVTEADEAYAIGPAPAAESYLSIPNLLAACKESGADAVHPGYGFLSENAEFARALEKAGIAFIGPNPKAISAMGDKITSKALAAKAGVNVIPGSDGAIKDAKEAVRAARKIGYPVMLKASAGGGGKGMRIAHDDAECRDGLKRATGEAETAFGDGRVFIEKFIETPRHIEIQVLADSKGNIVYLGERECSVQRRHQKVIEEAPSPAIDADTRRLMGEQAVTLARAVDYVSAGTVEFIADSANNFYFLEMNTRLQVEHPVTEMITGLDLVELMIRIAAGEALPFGQDDVTLTGWAMEARVYAEDPVRGFVPSSGRLVRYREPRLGDGAIDGLRVDGGVEEGGEISVYYDPMIAKVIAYGPDRETAVERLQRGLDHFHIRGVHHNIGFLASVLANPRFRAGELSTDFIAEEYPSGYTGDAVSARDAVEMACVAAAVHRAYQERAAMISGQVPGRERRVSDDWVVLLAGDRFAVRAVIVDGGYDLEVEGRPVQVRSAWKLGETLFTGTLDGAPVTMAVTRIDIAYRIGHRGAAADALVLSPHVAELHALMPVKEPPDLSRFLLSPMPGLLSSLAVAVGDAVEAGQELAVVEAMKMENVLKAEREAVIKAIKAKPGDSLAVDQVILEFE